ncbi:diacylglycerol O-acyltransferase 1-like isoform X3 [Malaclemys terrapin pileata]|uniref:diacylglycerol O-acyltransferase 1-like isoform X3 n=1 Tax=Malaclemys terrapin pileata TaxID=2991368 RepID=UPI0023A79FA4|nr:diacylglycerol O-acyltransferase 1-like isoform X3 [Malaclemys terrapin pileata]
MGGGVSCPAGAAPPPCPMDRCGRRERGWRGACCLMTLAGAAGNRQRRGVEARGRGPTGGGACEGFGIKMSGKRKKKINISINPEMPQPEMNDTEVRQDDPERLSCHTLCESLLSYGSGFNNFQGIFNWSVVLLVLTHVHMSLENFIRYGLLFDPVKIISVFLKDPYKWPAVYLIAASVLFALPAVFIERYLRKVRGSESIGLVLQSVNLLLLVTFPAVMVYRMQAITPADPSAHQSRRNERGQSKQIMYPMNLKVKDLYYFLLAPTLCYQLNFPRQKNCRQGYIIRRFIEMIFLFHLMLGLIQQWIVPNIHKSMKPINEIESTLLTEYILKLAVPNHFIWLIFFYWYFHSCLNCLAELLRFGDRQFYLDWWNADSVLQFWSRWNIPAHKWLDRHVYRPLLHHGYDKWQARMTVFLLSACFYEYLIAIPLKMFRFWMFFAMAAQVPLACLMKRLFGGNFGNIFMWISLVLGPPLMMLLYFHDYYIQHHRKDSSWRLFFF